jgi:uncharacterized SAM-binding protein YcdF (DUF218 family)
LIGTALLALVTYLVLFGWVASQAPLETATTSDAGIVLGAAAYHNGAWNPCLVARVRQGVALLNAGTVKRLILSGGVDIEDGASEAAVMRQIALQAGAAQSALLLETKATSTAENLEFSRALMRREGLSSAVIVSDPYHLPRASLIARKLQLTFTVSPALSSPCWTRGQMLSRYGLREPLALVDNWLRGNL